MDDESLENIVAAALERIRAAVDARYPFAGAALLEWMNSLYPNHSLQEYSTDPDAFPLLRAMVLSKGATPNTRHHFFIGSHLLHYEYVL